MNEILGFLAAGGFVYLALKVKSLCGDPVYYLLAVGAIITGYFISRGV